MIYQVNINGHKEQIIANFWIATSNSGNKKNMKQKCFVFPEKSNSQREKRRQNDKHIRTKSIKIL